MFLCTDGSPRQEGHAQCQTLRHQSRERRRGESTLGEARSDSVQCARCDSLQEEGGLANAGDSSGSSNAMRYTSTHHHRQDTDAESCSVKRRRIETSSNERRSTLSLTNMERQIQMFESPRCILYKGRNHSHEDHVADGGFHSWHQYNLVHAHVPISKATNNSITEGCEGRNNFEILLGKFGKNTQLGILFFSLCVDDMNMAGRKSQISSKATGHSNVLGCTQCD